MRPVQIGTTSSTTKEGRIMMSIEQAILANQKPTSRQPKGFVALLHLGQMERDLRRREREEALREYFSREVDYTNVTLIRNQRRT